MKKIVSYFIDHTDFNKHDYETEILNMVRIFIFIDKIKEY